MSFAFYVYVVPHFLNLLCVCMCVCVFHRSVVAEFVACKYYTNPHHTPVCALLSSCITFDPHIWHGNKVLCVRIREVVDGGTYLCVQFVYTGMDENMHFSLVNNVLHLL